MIRQRRVRLAVLIRKETLHPDDPVSDEMAALLSRLPVTGGIAAIEREWLRAVASIGPWITGRTAGMSPGDQPFGYNRGQELVREVRHRVQNGRS